MFGTGSSNEPLHTGKRIQGISSKRESNFTLGWANNNNQMNDYQEKRSQINQITGKVTQNVNTLKPTGYGTENIENSRPKNESYDAQDDFLLQYERLQHQYPDIPAEELKRILMGYEQERVQNTRKTPTQSLYAQQQSSYINQSPINYQQNLKRQPIRPRQSMKDIMYGGGIGTENENPKRVASRRNNSNLILGSQNYNYFKDQQNY